MTLTGSSVDYSKREDTLEEVIKVGVIGCGYWGPKLARNIDQISGARLSMVADLQYDRLNEIKAQYPGLITTTNYNDLLDEHIDAVIVATPVNTHYSIAKDALIAGKHVLVEKPITLDKTQANELIALAVKNDLTLMVGHTFVYNPAVEAVREVIRSGDLGKIFYIDSIRTNLGLLQPDINVMWDLAPHDLSIQIFILDDLPINVSARGGVYINKSRTLHEVVYMTLTFESGTMANLRLSWLDPVKQRKMTIVGSRKMLVYDDISTKKVVMYDKGVEIPPYSITEEEFHASYRHGEETEIAVKWIEPLRAECLHFLECIRKGINSRSNGETGMKILDILESAQKSLSKGGIEIPVEY